MFRRIRFRRWVVAGLGLAALVLPTTALAGTNVLDGRSPDTKDASLAAIRANVDPMAIKYLLRYGYTQAQINAMLAGTYKAVAPTQTATNAKVDPAKIKYLLRYGYTRSQINAMLAGTHETAAPTQTPVNVDPMAVRYLLRYGYTPTQITTMLTAASGRGSVDPMAIRYLLRYGYTPTQITTMLATPAPDTTGLKIDNGAIDKRAKVSQQTYTYLLWKGYTPSQIAAMLARAYPTSAPKSVPATPVDGRSPDTVDFGVLAHSPIVTVTRNPGFQWGDFGIGGAAAIGAMLLLGLSVRFLTNRQDRGGQTPVAAA